MFPCDLTCLALDFGNCAERYNSDSKGECGEYDRQNG